MCILGYPPEIQKLVDTFDPYRTAILEKDFSAVPEEALKTEYPTSCSTNLLSPMRFGNTRRFLRRVHC